MLVDKVLGGFMNKTSASCVIDTVEIDGIFCVEGSKRDFVDRRKKRAKRVLFERRYHQDPSMQNIKHIDEEV